MQNIALVKSAIIVLAVLGSGFAADRPASSPSPSLPAFVNKYLYGKLGQNKEDVFREALKCKAEVIRISSFYVWKKDPSINNNYGVDYIFSSGVLSEIRIYTSVFADEGKQRARKAYEEIRAAGVPHDENSRLKLEQWVTQSEKATRSSYDRGLKREYYLLKSDKFSPITVVVDPLFPNRRWIARFVLTKHALGEDTASSIKVDKAPAKPKRTPEQTPVILGLPMCMGIGAVDFVTNMDKNEKDKIRGIEVLGFQEDLGRGQTALFDRINYFADDKPRIIGVNSNFRTILCDENQLHDIQQGIMALGVLRKKEDKGETGFIIVDGEEKGHPDWLITAIMDWYVGGSVGKRASEYNIEFSLRPKITSMPSSIPKDATNK